MIEYILLPQTIEALGWTLIHSLWQGAVFAFVLVLTLIALRGYSAKSRYIVSVGLLSAFFLTISVTFFQQWQGANAQYEWSSVQMNDQVLNGTIAMDDVNTSMQPALLLEQVVIRNPEMTPQTYWLDSFREYFNNHLPLLVTLWLLGVLFLQLRFLGRLAYVQRLKHYGTELFPSEWNEKIVELENKLRIRKRIAYRMSRRVQSPMVIGWLKPFVLVPQQIFQSLSETEIYAVLAHEIAHIRREDFAINLLQTFLCNVFFFHPGVWWMSHQVDEEREHCCDDLAVAALGGPTAYAKTLINVSELQLRLQHNTHLAMSFSGKSNRKKTGFSDRIHRLFKVSEVKGTVKERFATVLILMSALVLGIAATESTVEENNDAVESQTEQIVSDAETNIEPVSFPQSTTKAPVDVVEEPENDPLPIEEESSDLLIEVKVNIDGELPVETGHTFDGSLPIAKPADPVSPAQPVAPVMKFTNRGFDDTRIDALIMACMEGDLEFVQTLVNSGIDINGIGSEGFTPLMIAVSNREAKIVKYLIEQGADVNVTSNGWNALIEAADEGSIESMKYLLDAGADVNYYWTPGSPSAITMASSENFLDCLKMLVKYGADINGVGMSMPPLHIAAEEGSSDVLDFLIDQNVDVNKKDVFGRTALMYAAEEGNQRSFKKLLQAGAKENISDNEGFTARDYAYEENQRSILKLSENETPDIHQATFKGLIEKVQRMVEQGQDVDTRDNYGRTPLHIAAAENHNIDMRILIDLGADVDAQDHQGRTPLMYAAADGKANAAALLVSKLANVNIEDADGMRAYEWAQSGNNPDLAKFLELITNPKNKERQKEKALEQKSEKKNEAKRNSKAQKQGNQRETFHINENSQHLKQYNLKEGDSRLLDVVSEGSIQDLEALLAVEMDLNAADETGQTALMTAVRGNRLQMAKILIANGADVNRSSFSGLTALHYAALENRGEMAVLLLDNNASVDPVMRYSSTDGNYSTEPIVWQYIGATPLLIATESSNEEVVKVLLAAGANPHQVLTKKEFRLNENRESYLSGSEVMGIDEDFLKEVEIKVTDDSWTPFKQATFFNKKGILILYQN